jgi:hypothetical protein
MHTEEMHTEEMHTEEMHIEEMHPPYMLLYIYTLSCTSPIHSLIYTLSYALSPVAAAPAAHQEAR